MSLDKYTLSHKSHFDKYSYSVKYAFRHCMLEIYIILLTEQYYWHVLISMSIAIFYKIMTFYLKFEIIIIKSIKL
jgi:hypothetical protein